MSANLQIIKTGLWRWLRGTGLERFEFSRTRDEWNLRGVILVLMDDTPVEARYELGCNHAFLTRRALISVRGSEGERCLELSAENGRWYENGRENLSVRGALDLDLSWSPSTNTLPIRRLELKVGQSSGELTAAWVRFPSLTVEPLPQEYLRISERLYRYSSRGGAFTAQLQVDDQGLVVEYEGLWQQVRSENRL